MERHSAASRAATQAQIDALVEALKEVAPGALDTYRDLALNLAIALHHRRPPDASCWQALYVLLVLELDDTRLDEREAVKAFLVALDDYAAARSPDAADVSEERLQTVAAALRNAHASLAETVVP